MALPIDTNRPFPSSPPVYPWLRCGLNPFGTRSFYFTAHRHTTFLPVQPGGVADYRSPTPYLLPIPQIPPPPLSEFVGVLTSVPTPGSSSCKMARTHTHELLYRGLAVYIAGDP